MVNNTLTRRKFLRASIVGASGTCAMARQAVGRSEGSYSSPSQQQISANTGFVLLTFDHAKPSVYETAFPITREFQYPALLSVVANRISPTREDLLTAGQLRELHATGWEIGSHSMADHPDFMGLSVDDIARQCAESKQWLRQHEFGEDAPTIVYPYEKVDGRVADVARRYFAIGFGGSREPGAPIVDPLRIGRINGDDVDATKRAIDTAAKQGQVLAIMYHTVGDDDDDRIGTTAFRETLEHIRDKGDALRAITPSTLNRLLNGNHREAERTETSSSTTPIPTRTSETRTNEKTTSTTRSTTTETTSRSTIGSSSTPSTGSEATPPRETDRTTDGVTERTLTEGPGFGVLAALGGLVGWIVYRLSNIGDDHQ